MKKPKTKPRGRSGGRPPKYDEETKRVGYRTPKSEVPALDEHVGKILEKHLLNKKIEKK